MGGDRSGAFSFHRYHRAASEQENIWAALSGEEMNAPKRRKEIGGRRKVSIRRKDMLLPPPEISFLLLAVNPVGMSSINKRDKWELIPFHGLSFKKPDDQTDRGMTGITSKRWRNIMVDGCLYFHFFINHYLFLPRFHGLFLFLEAQRKKVKRNCSLPRRDKTKETSPGTNPPHIRNEKIAAGFVHPFQLSFHGMSEISLLLFLLISSCHERESWKGNPLSGLLFISQR